MLREATICESVEETMIGEMKKLFHIKRGRLPRGLCSELRHSGHQEGTGCVNPQKRFLGTELGSIFPTTWRQGTNDTSLTRFSCYDSLRLAGLFRKERLSPLEHRLWVEGGISGFCLKKSLGLWANPCWGDPKERYANALCKYMQIFQQLKTRGWYRNLDLYIQLTRCMTCSILPGHELEPFGQFVLV